ncbi:MAG: HAMP domain-containing protein [Candidatus Firestonebacteria bacterium]
MRKVHRNLSFQLVFVIILVFSIVSLIAGYFDIKFQKKEWLKAESEHAKVIADTILKSIEDIMLSGKQKKLDSVLKNLNEGQHLSGVRILKVESVSKNNKSAELTYKNGEPIYVFKQQIVNKKKCYGCHKSNESIIGFLEISISWKSLMDNIMDNAKMHIIMTLAILLVISLVLVFFMKKVVNRPIQKLLLAFNKVSQGDLNVNVDIKENNELDVLAENFNKMVDNLKQSKESI